MSKKIICIICSLIISLSIFVIPSFAESLSITTLPVISSFTFNDLSNNGLNLGTYNNSSIYGASSKNDIYIFATNTALFVCSTDSTSSFLYRNYRNNNSVITDTATFGLYDESSNLFYSSWLTINQNFTSCNFSFFDNEKSGLSAVRDYIDNSSSSDSVYDFSTTVEVKPGTVLYIGVPANGILSMSGTTTFPVNSTWLGSDKYPEAPQRVSRASSLPSAGTQFPLSPNSKPNWQPSSEGSNLLGQNKNAYFSESTWSFDVSGFLTFYNPYYFNPFTDGSSDQSSILNSSVYLTISGYSSIRSYPLKESVVSSGNITSDSPDNYESYSDPTIVDNGDGTGSITNWTNQDGSTSSEAPSNNGYNSAPAAQSIEGYLSQIRNTLTKFANDFIELVQAPISHIQSLIQAGSGFMNALQGMYAWLPAQIQGYLISALTLIIAIGVFKVFL